MTGDRGPARRAVEAFSMSSVVLEHKEEVEPFRHKLRLHIMRLLEEVGSISVGQAVKHCLNCDPAFLLEVMEELREEGCLARTEEGEAAYALRNRAVPPARRSDGDEQKSSRYQPKIPATGLKRIAEDILSLLPEASPVHSQWWYALPSYARLIALLESMDAGDIPTAFLGCATLGSVFSQLHRNHILMVDLDRHLLDVLSPACSSEVEFLCADIGHEVPRDYAYQYGVVFADPPWGRAGLLDFLRGGAALLARGGRMVISFPQEFTRPSIASERQGFLQLAQTLGLEHDGLIPSATEYGVPVFEYLAYRRLGITLNSPWRRGDLYLFRRTQKVSSAFFQSADNRRFTWDQFVLGGRRLFLKRDGVNEKGPPEISHIPGLHSFLLPSTSSRCSAWKHASLVSTRNCVALASGRGALAEILSTLSSSPSPRRWALSSSGASCGSKIAASIKEMLADRIW